MAFGIKIEDSRHKARHVVRGHKINPSHLESHSLVVKTMSARIL